MMFEDKIEAKAPCTKGTFNNGGYTLGSLRYPLSDGHSRYSPKYLTLYSLILWSTIRITSR